MGGHTSRRGPIGTPRPRVGAADRATGRTRYADDLSFPGALHCRMVRSPYAHAEIVGIDPREALALPGVKLVVTGADLPTRYGILPVSQDETALAVGEVRHVGEAVAAVVARDEETAARGAALVRVQYAPRPVIAEPEDALAQAPSPIARGGAIHRVAHVEFGDVDAGMAEADLVVEGFYRYGGNTHLPLETHASVADVDGDGRVTLWSSTQVPHYLHRVVAEVLGIDPAEVRVVATPNGGGFGARSDVFGHEVVVAHAARVLGRPVRICLSREEVFECHRGRHPVDMRLVTGVKRDGTLTAVDLEAVIDGGAYGSYGAASTLYVGALQPVTYRVSRYRYRGVRVLTHKPACGPKRGHGTPQGRFALEVQLDRIAEALGRDPADLRLGILESEGVRTVNGLVAGTNGLAECIREVTRRSGFSERRGRLPRGRGLGIAASTYISGAALPLWRNDLPHSAVQVRVDRTGAVTAFSGATDIGQGSDDVLAACVAEVLGIGLQRVRVVTADTGMTPVDLGTYSSRVTLMMGNAAVQAAERVRDLILRGAAEELEVPVERLAMAGERVFDTGGSSAGMSFAEAARAAEARFGALGTVGSYTPPDADVGFRGGGVGPSPAYSFTAAVVEVDVCPDTGWIGVEKVWIAHDLGRALNPTLAVGQVEGSVYMALGEALMEDHSFRVPPGTPSALLHRGPSMLDYKSPTALDMPEVDVALVERPDPAGPFGAKEVGQGPLLPVPPALANAVFDAVGVRIDEVPITPEKVLRALRSGARRGRGRYGPDRLPPVAWPPPVRVARDPTPEQAPGRAAAGEGPC